MRRRYPYGLPAEIYVEFGGCARPCWDREGEPEHTYAWGSCEKAPACAQPDPEIGFWCTWTGADGHPDMGLARLPFGLIFPWAMALPVKERHQMLEEIADSDDPEGTLYAWQRTAEVWTNPDALNVLGGEGFNEDDYKDAPRPEPEDM